MAVSEFVVAGCLARGFLPPPLDMAKWDDAIDDVERMAVGAHFEKRVAFRRGSKSGLRSAGGAAYERLDWRPGPAGTPRHGPSQVQGTAARGRPLRKGGRRRRSKQP